MYCVYITYINVYYARILYYTPLRRTLLIVYLIYFLFRFHTRVGIHILVRLRMWRITGGNAHI